MTRGRVVFCRTVFALLLLATAGGCAHEVHADYAQYLANNRGQSDFAAVHQPATYYLDPATADHRLEFRSGMAGVGNLWVVEFGEILDATLQDPEFQAQFTSLTKVSAVTETSDLLMTFHLDQYRFADFSAHVTLTIEALRGGRILVSRTYEADGISQGAKMFWGGVFAMKNAIQQSTKSALDNILRLFLYDLQGAVST